MEINENIAEYYDELYPVIGEQKKFYEEISEGVGNPVKYLRVGCGIGTFEHNLARDGADATGIETSPELLESANRKRRTQLMSIRFFQMNYLEMSRYLGKGFYNIISILNDRIILIHDKILLEKFFFDCKQLLAPGGKLVIGLRNFSKLNNDSISKLPTRESIRVKLYTQIVTKENGKKYMQQDLETGSGKMLPVTRDAEIYPLKKEEIEEFAKKSGFTKIEFFGGFNKEAFTSDSDDLIALIS